MDSIGLDGCEYGSELVGLFERMGWVVANNGLDCNE